jgi:Acetyltransferases
MLIRKIEMRDLDEVYKLLNELYENKIQYSIFVKKYKKSLNEDGFYGIVAEEDTKVVGVLIARIIDRLVKSKYTLFADDLIVDKKYRQRGIGKLLLENATVHAKKINCETFELTSYITNENSHKLYESNGFKKQHYKFKKNL